MRTSLLTPNAVFEAADEDLAAVPPAMLAQALGAMRDRLESAVATLDVASAMLGPECRDHPLAAHISEAAEKLRPWTSLEWETHAELLRVSSPTRATG
jgi:hypothetical protein